MHAFHRCFSGASLHAQSMAKHATMALAVLLHEPAGADALLGHRLCREVPPGLREATSAREPVLLAALEVQPAMPGQ